LLENRDSAEKGCGAVGGAAVGVVPLAGVVVDAPETGGGGSGVANNGGWNVDVDVGGGVGREMLKLLLLLLLPPLRLVAADMTPIGAADNWVRLFKLLLKWLLLPLLIEDADDEGGSGGGGQPPGTAAVFGYERLDNAEEADGTANEADNDDVADADVAYDVGGGCDVAAGGPPATVGDDIAPVRLWLLLLLLLPYGRWGGALPLLLLPVA
jgi:hypothetical protein